MGLCERRTLKQGVQLLDEIPSQPRLRPTKASSQPRLGWLWHLFWRSASAFFSAALARVALHGGRRHKCNSTRWSTIMLYTSYRRVEVCLLSHWRHCRDTTSDDNKVATSVGIWCLESTRFANAVSHDSRRLWVENCLAIYRWRQTRRTKFGVRCIVQVFQWSG